MFADGATIPCMNQLKMKVLVSRPRIRPVAAPIEVRRPDFCWTRSGEILAPAGIPCADVDTCGCSWAFAGVSSARATTWGVVEWRTVSRVVCEVADGQHVAGSTDFEDYVMAGISDITRRIRPLPLGTIVGIWTLTPVSFSLYTRLPCSPTRRPPCARAGPRLS